MKALAWTGLGLVALAVAAVALVYHPAIPPIGKPPAFPRAQIERGAELAAIGDCAVCHTPALGRDYAGGRPLPTPFGVVYVSNITPDPDTGIGTWSEDAFRRAMRRGIAQSGRHLYPALPYPHFTRATDDDIAALYAFLMTRPPIANTTPPNRLPFPVNIRATVAGWNLLFLDPGAWQPDPAHDAVWNRGQYLTEAVGHCGACHTGHNALGAEQAAALHGGVMDGWYAPPLAGTARGWTADALTTYLRTGFDAAHGAAAGPMTEVSEKLATVPDGDVRAIATYIASGLPAQPPAPFVNTVAANAVFAGACAGCHGPAAPMMQAGLPSLSQGAAVNAPTPRDTVQTILNGLPWREGTAQPYMPAFGDTLADTQVAELARYLRAAYSTQPAWTDVEATIKSVRQGNGS